MFKVSGGGEDVFLFLLINSGHLTLVYKSNAQCPIAKWMNGQLYICPIASNEKNK